MGGHKFVSISEFLSLTRLNEVELCRMLSSGQLSGEFTKDGSLTIDIGSLTTNSLETRSISFPINLENQSSRLEEEEIASDVLEFLDEAIEEALSLANAWHLKASNTKNE